MSMSDVSDINCWSLNVIFTEKQELNSDPIRCDVKEWNPIQRHKHAIPSHATQRSKEWRDVVQSNSIHVEKLEAIMWYIRHWTHIDTDYEGSSNLFYNFLWGLPFSVVDLKTIWK